MSHRNLLTDIRQATCKQSSNSDGDTAPNSSDDRVEPRIGVDFQIASNDLPSPHHSQYKQMTKNGIDENVSG
jgi:hypothetical protein